MLATHSHPDVDAYAEGRYVTDGVDLFRLLEDASEDQAMVALEDCRTLDVVLFTADDLRERMRPVEQRPLTVAP
jgi:hypothetical protein